VSAYLVRSPGLPSRFRSARTATVATEPPLPSGRGVHHCAFAASVLLVMEESWVSRAEMGYTNPLPAQSAGSEFPVMRDVRQKLCRRLHRELTSACPLGAAPVGQLLGCLHRNLAKAFFGSPRGTVPAHRPDTTAHASGRDDRRVASTDFKQGQSSGNRTSDAGWVVTSVVPDPSNFPGWSIARI
jgi:hypothetical protein